METLIEFLKENPGWHTEINLATFYLYSPDKVMQYSGSFDGLVEYITSPLFADWIVEMATETAMDWYK
jgi:hypothetical protein